MWIVKPVASSRGRGIYIINNVSVRVCVLCGQLFDAGHVDRVFFSFFHCYPGVAPAATACKGIVNRDGSGIKVH